MKKNFIYLLCLGAIMVTSAFHSNAGTYVQMKDSGYAEVNGTKLYYESQGSGVPLMLIHGSFGDRRFWDPQFDELSKKFRVVRYDIRGFGRSAFPDSNDVYTDAADLKALMEFLGINKAHICGLSLGSIILFDFVLLYPEKCLSIIAAGPRIAGDVSDEYRTPASDSMKTIIARTTDIAKTRGAKDATDYLWNGNDLMRKGVVSPKTREILLKMGYEYSWWRYIHTSKRQQAFPMAIAKLGEIKIPVLIVTSERDFDLCQEVAVRMAQEIPGAKLVSIKGAGHIVNMERPLEFNRAVSEFIDKIK